MKKLCVAAILSVFFATPAAAQWADSERNVVYLALGKTQGHNSYALGTRGANFGVEIGVLADSEYAEGDVLDYPVPHNSYVSLGEKKMGNTYGMDVLGYIPLGTVFSAGVGAGLYFGEKRQLARSTVTGWVYTESKKTTLAAAGQFTVQARLGSGMLGVSFHSLRGTQVTLGLQF